MILTEEDLLDEFRKLEEQVRARKRLAIGMGASCRRCTRQGGILLVGGGDDRFMCGYCGALYSGSEFRL